MIMTFWTQEQNKRLCFSFGVMLSQTRPDIFLVKRGSTGFSRRMLLC